jgi:hypothetical protein
MEDPDQEYYEWTKRARKETLEGRLVIMAALCPTCGRRIRVIFPRGSKDGGHLPGVVDCTCPTTEWTSEAVLFFHHFRLGETPAYQGRTSIYDQRQD